VIADEKGLFGIGSVNTDVELGLHYDPIRFEEIVHEVFAGLLRDLCARVVEYDTDIVLLAGRPSKLGAVQELVRMHLPLHRSRVIPMHGYYAFHKYPYEAKERPGTIADPKSAVVVGAALEFLSANGDLPQFSFEMKPGAGGLNRYYWVVMTESYASIPESRIIFRPDDPNNRQRRRITQPRTLIGRMIGAGENSEAAPVSLLQIDRPENMGPIDVTVEFLRERNPDDPREEMLRLGEVEGYVGAVDVSAVAGENVHLKWRTLREDKIFLDTGGLSQIDLERRT
jgi:hypothetical protein